MSVHSPTNRNTTAKPLDTLITVVVTLSSASAGYSDNYHGSIRCNKNMGPICTTAFNYFTDRTVYNGYTFCVNGNCAAIYRCDGDYPALTGTQLRGLFAPIYGGQGCKGCSSHASNSGSCEVTPNFRSNCLDSGNPNCA
ncbi:hypothetical protein BGX26_011437 [Mortierella sp. AD094]|nr:hypothetical protein BGX26_011437 [Mortierella sp. AD094]